MRGIHFHRNASGDCPVEEFLDSLGPKHARKIARVLRMVKELPLVPRRYLKNIEGTDGLWEVRAGFWDSGTRTA
jgi:hypothetical protein